MSFLCLWHRVIRHLEQQPNLSSNIAQRLQLDLVWELLRRADPHEEIQDAFFLFLPVVVPLWSAWAPSSAKLLDTRSLWVQAWLAERPQRLGELQATLMSRQFGCWLWQGVAALAHGVTDPGGAAGGRGRGAAAAAGDEEEQQQQQQQQQGDEEEQQQQQGEEEEQQQQGEEEEQQQQQQGKEAAAAHMQGRRSSFAG